HGGGRLSLRPGGDLLMEEEMSEAHGTKELKELLDLILKGVEVGVLASKDGKVDAQDLGLLLTLVPHIQPAVDGVGMIPAELGDLSAEEAAEVIAHVMARLSVDNAKAVAIVE